MVELSFEQVNRYMQNMGVPQFSYDSLKAAHDHDPRINEIIVDFTEDYIKLKTSEVDDLEPKKKRRSKDKVKQMAKKAVDLKDL